MLESSQNCLHNKNIKCCFPKLWVNKTTVRRFHRTVQLVENLTLVNICLKSEVETKIDCFLARQHDVKSFGIEEVYKKTRLQGITFFLPRLSTYLTKLLPHSLSPDDLFL